MSAVTSVILSAVHTCAEMAVSAEMVATSETAARADPGAGKSVKWEKNVIIVVPWLWLFTGIPVVFP